MFLEIAHIEQKFEGAKVLGSEYFWEQKF